MKTAILTLLIVVAGFAAHAGNGNKRTEKNTTPNNTQLISGKVIDKLSGEEIAGAEIKLGDQIIYTDLEGNFSTSVQINKTELIINSVSYNEAKIIIDSYSYNTIYIELASK